ncbi:MAG: phosphomethylpyrimidine synthase ThiC, partial [bacterium]
MKSPAAPSLDDRKLDAVTRGPLPGSRKIHLVSPRDPSIRVPAREIALHPTHARAGGAAPNAPVVVYDTSGPYTDPAASIALRRGLPPRRRPGVLARG